MRLTILNSRAQRSVLVAVCATAPFLVAPTANGATAFYTTGSQLRTFETTNSDAPSFFAQIPFALGSAQGVAIDNNSTAWLSNWGRELVSVDLTTRAVTPRSRITGIPANLEDLAWDPINNRLLGLNFDSIFEINRATSVATLLGTFTGASQHQGALAFSSSGKISIVGDSGGRLYDLSPTQSGFSAVQRGTLLWSSAAMTYDPNTGDLLAADYTSTAGPIWRVHADGSRTVLRMFTGGAPTGLAFAPIPSPITALPFAVSAPLLLRRRRRE